MAAVTYQSAFAVHSHHIVTLTLFIVIHYIQPKFFYKFLL